MVKTVVELNNKLKQVISEHIETTSKQLENDLEEKYERAVENSNHIHEWCRKE